MLRTTLFLIGIFAVLMIAPAAAAGFSMTVTPPEDAPAPIREGGSASLTFDVAMAYTGNMICGQAGTLTVTLEPTGVDEGTFDATADPETLAFDIGANAYLEAAEQQWSDSKSATLMVSIGELPEGHGETHLYGLKATYDGTAPEGCQPESEFGQVSDEGQIDVPVLAPTPEETPNGESGGNGTDGGDDTAEGPLFSPLVLVLGLVLYAAARRRSA